MTQSQSDFSLIRRILRALGLPPEAVDDIITKGQDDQKSKTKRGFLEEWVRAVNADGRFGAWKWAVSRNPADVRAIVDQAVG